MKLRGDSPDCYKDYNIDVEKNGLTFWGLHQLKDDREVSKIRKNKKICKLYNHYHYNMNVVNEGCKFITFYYSDELVKIISAIQKNLRKDIANKRIAIECNPTSNFLIGNIDKYENHPISKFYNKNLTYDQEKINENPLINVSINTDDQGVFNTSLRSEYALLALSLSKKVDDNGNKIYNDDNIYKWLDAIRENGIGQSFK